MNTETTNDWFDIFADRSIYTLYWLHRFRWLTSNQLARLIWPEEAKQAQRMAQRVLRTQIDAGEVLARRLPNGGVAYVLGERGAQRLANCGVDVRLRGERDARLGAPYHRALANEIAIHGIQQGWQVYTENEIQRGEGPLRSLKAHIPDLLFEQSDDYPSLSWCEVENAAKSPRKLMSLMELAEELVGSKDGYPVGDVYIDHFVFVAPHEAAVKSVIRAMLAADDAGVIKENSIQRIELWLCNLSRKLAWSGEIRRYSAFEILTHYNQND